VGCCGISHEIFSVDLGNPMFRGFCEHSSSIGNAFGKANSQIFRAIHTAERRCEVCIVQYDSTNCSIEIAKLLDTVAVNTCASIHSYCRWEKRRPFTQNSVDLIAFKNNTYQQYIQQRQQRPAQNLGNPAPGVFKFRMPEPEKYEAELGVIAEVTSYFDICYKRASDVVPMLIETELFEKFSELLGEQLIPNLGITGEGSLERCVRLAVEDEQVRFRREELERKRATLEEASVILRSI